MKEKITNGITGRETVRQGIVVDELGEQAVMLVGTKGNGGESLTQAIILATTTGVRAVREERIQNKGIQYDTVGYSEISSDPMLQRRARTERVLDMTTLGGTMTDVKDMKLKDLRRLDPSIASMMETLLVGEHKPTFGQKELDSATPMNPAYPRSEVELTFAQVGPGNKNEVNAIAEREKKAEQEKAERKIQESSSTETKISDAEEDKPEVKKPNLLKISHNLRQEALKEKRGISLEEAKVTLLVQDEVSRALQVLSLMNQERRQRNKALGHNDSISIPPVQISERQPQEAVA